MIENFKDTPEVKAFYTKYEDAKVEVRDDYLSYFAGNEIDFRVRMNLYFDENYELDHIDFHCYFQKEHQFELAQEDIATSLEKYECKKHSIALSSIEEISSYKGKNCNLLGFADVNCFVDSIPDQIKNLQQKHCKCKF